jgi:glycosyltransferase involved in cell wall biosynthesis
MNIYRTTPSIPAPLHYYELIANVLANNKYDIIQTELTESLKLVHLFPQDTKKIFVQIENRGQIIYDYGKVNGIKEGYLSYVVKNTEFLEYSYMALYDAILTLNPTDCSIIQKVLPNTKVYNSPFAILDKDIAEPPQSLDFKFKSLIFIGGESHYPNLDGLEWFLSNSEQYLSHKEIEKIFVTGIWSEQTKTRLSKLEKRVEFTGFVEDLSSLLKTSISIVPIRIGGGGIRTKILLSMAQCSPVVSTSTAAIGITGEQKEYLKVVDTMEGFMDGIKFFLNKNEETIQLICSANELIRQKYSLSYTCSVRNEIYQDILASSK